MLGTKYLGQIIKEQNIQIFEEGKNTLIISPCGSGKTHYILNDLCKEYTNVLYLCDNNNLKYQVEKDCKELSINPTIWTYAKFGYEVQYSNGSLINQYDLIICDEVHNLIDYQNFSTSSYELILATEYLIKYYEHTKIVFFTATPKYLDILVKYKYHSMDSNFKCLDFSDDEEYPEIRRYTEKMKTYMGHYSDIAIWLKRYEPHFKSGGKLLVFTRFIDTMETIEGMCNNFNYLKPICVWGLNAKEEKKMNNEQLRVRKHLLDYGVLAEGYNVLIINRATETGVNIVDKRMDVVICDTTDDVQQIQARNRIRHDIDLLVLKTKEREELDFSIDESLLDSWHTKQVILEFVITKNNMRDKHGTMLTVNKLVKDESILGCKGFAIESAKKQIDKKRCTMYKITKITK